MQTPEEENETTTQKTHHLLRIRIYRRNFEKLKEMAESESLKEGEFISISDLVRGAIASLIQNQETRKRLDVIINPKFKVRKG